METINQEQADRINMQQRYAYISEGCDGIWGEGNTPAAALADALTHIREGNNGPIMRPDADRQGGEHEATDAELAGDMELLELAK